MVDTDTLLLQASITNNGSILLADTVVCDGYESGRDIAVFTHIHTDHTEFFDKAMGWCSHVIVSKPTRDLLVALKDESLLLKNNLHAMNFGDSFAPVERKIPLEKITLKESQHILGSSQVLVETKDGTKIAYTSDFTYPNTKPIPCDVLVIDSTHGDPRFDLVVERDSVERRIVDYVNEEVKKGQPVFVRAHRGRLQHIMSLLSEYVHEDIPFLSSGIDIKLAEVYHKYGMPSRTIYDYDEYEGKKIARGTYPFVQFRTHGSSKTLKEEAGARRILVGAFEFTSGSSIKHHVNNTFHVDLADHGNYKSILGYIERALPKVVITDNHRSRFGKTLAEAVNGELGIPAKSMPEKNSKI